MTQGGEAGCGMRHALCSYHEDPAWTSESLVDHRGYSCPRLLLLVVSLKSSMLSVASENARRYRTSW